MTANARSAEKARNLDFLGRAAPDVHAALAAVERPVPPAAGPRFNARFTLAVPVPGSMDIPTFGFLTGALGRAAAEGIQFFDEPRTDEATFLIVVGAQDTESVLAAIERTRAAVVFIVEPTAAHLAGTLETVDWTRVLAAIGERDGALHFLIEESADRVTGRVWRIMRGTNPAAADGITVSAHGHGDLARGIARNLADEASLAVAQLGFFHDELLMIANTYRNLTRPGARVFTRRPDAEPGLPAFVVGSGPSLDWAMDTIGRLKDRAVVVSAGSALRPLMKAGIRPDFQIEIENIQVSPLTAQAAAEHDLAGVRLVAATSMEPEAAAPFADVVHFFRKALSPYPLFAEGEDQALRLPGPTVVNAALTFAQDLGFRDIYLFGTDFGSQWPDRHHAKDAFHYTEGAGHRHRGYSIEVEANFGGTCFTDHGLFAARANAAEAIRAMAPGCRVFNCSDGVAIPGAAPTRPDDVALKDPAGGKDAVLAAIVDGFAAVSADVVAQAWRDAGLAAAIAGYVDDFARRLGAIRSFADRGYHRDLMAQLRPAMGYVETPAPGTADAVNLLFRGTILGMLIFLEYHRARVADPARVEAFGAIARDALLAALETMRGAALAALSGDAPAPPPEPEVWTPGSDARLPALPPIPRNAACPCGSGRKFKHCHGKAA